MAESTIGAQEGALKAGADAVVHAGAAIRKASDEVRNQVLATNGRWVGRGSDDFRQLMGEWDAKTERMIKVLDSLGEALGATEKDRAALEETVSGSVKSLNSAMSGI
jgi:WXG100 family type VII secretion target